MLPTPAAEWRSREAHPAGVPRPVLTPAVVAMRARREPLMCSQVCAF